MTDWTRSSRLSSGKMTLAIFKRSSSSDSSRPDLECLSLNGLESMDVIF